MIPSSSADIAEMLQYVLGNCVIPEFANELLVESNTPTVGEVKINTGAALVYGIHYTNDADIAIAIPATGGSLRIDRIVLRKDAAAQTGRVVRIAGVEANPPAIPALTANDIPLAWTYIDAAYNPAADIVRDEDIHDEREFTHAGLLAGRYSTENIMPNSEWFGMSGEGANLPPDMWEDHAGGAPAAISGGSPEVLGIPQPRGSYMSMTAVTGQGIQTTILLPQLSTESNETYTLKFNTLMANSSTLGVRIRSWILGVGASAIITTKEIPVTADRLDYMVRFDIPSTNDAILLELYDVSANNLVTALSQMILVHGYVPGNYRPKHEIVWFNNELASASWGATAKSTSTTTVGLSTSFTSTIEPGMRGTILRVKINDSGSLGGTSRLSLFHLSSPTTLGLEAGGVDVSGITNDAKRSRVVYVPTAVNGGFGAFRVRVEATGAGTLDATLVALGVIT